MNQTRTMKATAAWQESQPPLPPSEIASRAVLQERDRHLHASIKGDLTIIVTEQAVARGPIIGRYTVETQGMREPLCVLWHAQDGKVLNGCARSTEIAFDLSGTRAGHLWTTVITVQVTDAEMRDAILEGTFVQVRVIDA